MKVFLSFPRSLVFRFAVCMQAYHLFEYVTAVVPFVFYVLTLAYFKSSATVHPLVWISVPFIVFSTWMFTAFCLGSFYLDETYVRTKRNLLTFDEDGRFSSVLFSAISGALLLIAHATFIASLYLKGWAICTASMAAVFLHVLVLVKAVTIMRHVNYAKFSKKFYASLKKKSA